MEIFPYSDQYKTQTIELILNILEKEFCFYGIDRPDLYAISETYQKKKGNFWIAVENGVVIGSIALSNYEKNRGYLKRLYVHKNWRKKGVARKLFSTLIQFAKEHNYREVFLATDESMVAANIFYQKIGFKNIPFLPKDMPPFGDTLFYKMDI